MVDVDLFAEKRAELLRFLSRPLGASSNGCLQLPDNARRCPQSFGNQHQILVSVLMAAHALRVRVLPTTSLTCNSMLRFKQMRCLRTFAAVRSSSCHHFNQERNLRSRDNSKFTRSVALSVFSRNTRPHRTRAYMPIRESVPAPPPVT